MSERVSESSGGHARGAGGVGTVVEVRILSGARSGEQTYFFDSPNVHIGRNLASDVVLPDPGVSRHHAELVHQSSGYRLRDVGSTAGTFVMPGGKPVDEGGLLLDPTAGAGKAEVSDDPQALPAASSVDVSIGQIGPGPRCRIGVGLSVPFGRYLLTGRLGGGGMAEVFMARQTGLGGMFRPVALKLIQPEMWSLIDAGAMFLDEARIAAEINHHNVVKIYDVGEHDGVLFLAMEYLRGVTVSNLTAQLAQRGERMPPDLVAALIGEACAGLHAAHQLRDMSGRLQNVVHRDVSPSNLMVLPEGLVKVIDFGVARADTLLHKTEEGLQGKPAYMSPEQVQAQPLDCRSDVFALGVVLYELCSGQPLFYREDTVATFYAVVRGEVPPLRSLCPTASPRLEAIVMRALAKLPEQRFQSAAELAAELDEVVTEAGGRFSSISAVGRYLTERGVNLTSSPPALLNQIPKALYVDSGRVKKATPHELSADHDEQHVGLAEGEAAGSVTGSTAGPPAGSLDVPASSSGDAVRARGAAELRPGAPASPPLSRHPLFTPPSRLPVPSLPLSRPPPLPAAAIAPPVPAVLDAAPAASGAPPPLPAAAGAPPLPAAGMPPLSKPPLPAAGHPLGKSLLPSMFGTQALAASKLRRPLSSEPQRLVGLVLDGRYRLQRYLGRSPKSGRPLPKLTYLAALLHDGPEETRARAAGRLHGEQVIVAVCGRGDHLQPLDDEQHTRLQQFAAARRLPAVPESLLPVLHCGELPARSEPDGDGSRATFVVMPQVTETLLTYTERVPLSLADTLTLARQLCRALAAAAQHTPGFVHGDLKPDRIGLWPPSLTGSPAPLANLHPVLLDFHLEAVLHETAAPAHAPGSGSPYLAPERWAGAPPSAAADAFALAAILYEMLGGDLLRAAQYARHRREIPPLPTQPGLLPHQELAILAALRAEPALRPDAARLAALLAPPEPDSEPSQLDASLDGVVPVGGAEATADPTASWLRVPLAAVGSQQLAVTPTGRKVVLLTMTAPAGREHVTQPLPLSTIPGLLPAPLLLIAHGESLMIELDGLPSGRGRDRPSLYHDAHDPSTRCERYTLKPSTEDGYFDVGHRRLSVQRLHYSSVVGATPGPLAAALPTLQLVVAAAGALQRLVVLHADHEDTTYALCIAVG